MAKMTQILVQFVGISDVVLPINLNSSQELQSSLAGSTTILGFLRLSKFSTTQFGWTQ